MSQKFQVSGMSCGHCVNAVQNAVQTVDPEAQVTVDLETGHVDVPQARNRARTSWPRSRTRATACNEPRHHRRRRAAPRRVGPHGPALREPGPACCRRWRAPRAATASTATPTSTRCVSSNARAISVFRWKRSRNWWGSGTAAGARVRASSALRKAPGRGAEQRIADMQSMRQTLAHLVHCCHGDARPDCPILDDLSKP